MEGSRRCGKIPAGLHFGKTKVQKQCQECKSNARSRCRHRSHNLVIMRAQIKLKFIKRKKTIKHRWNNKNLKERSNKLGRKIEENLTESEGNSIEERWKRLKENIIESAMDIVGAEERMPARKPWITREMVDEMEERRKWKHQSTDKARQEYKRLGPKQ